MFYYEGASTQPTLIGVISSVNDNSGVIGLSPSVNTIKSHKIIQRTFSRIFILHVTACFAAANECSRRKRWEIKENCQNSLTVVFKPQECVYSGAPVTGYPDLDGCKL